MKIALGADHRGFELKEKVKDYLQRKGIEFHDFGTVSNSAVDYPDFAFKVGESVAHKKFDYGIIICYTGIGMSIAANKVKGIRAALCLDDKMAYYARAHNDANILVLSAKLCDFEHVYKSIIDCWLTQNFEGERHRRRIEKISNYENSTHCSR